MNKVVILGAMLAVAHATPSGVQRRAAAQQPPAWQLTLELRIGGADDEGNPFSRVTGVAVGRDGAIYVADELENSIRMFSPQGRLLRTFGRKGSGPGEFQVLTGVGLKGDSVYAEDLQLRRLTLFTPDGKVATTLRTGERPSGQPFSVLSPQILLSDGAVLAIPDRPGDRPITRLPLFRMGRTGGTPAVLVQLDWRDNARGQAPRQQGVFNFTRPISSESLWVVSPAGDAIFVVDRPLPRSAAVAGFQVTRLNARGDTVFSRTYRYTPQALSREVRNRFEAAARARPVLRRAGVDPDAAIRAMALPDYLPPITDVVAGRDGTVWLKREAFEREQVDWMVLDARGEIIATLRLPANLQVHQADRRNVWGVVPDDMDVPQVIRYRVSPSPAQGRR